MVVSVIAVKSEMKTVGCKEFTFEYDGSGVMVLSQLRHASLSAQNCTVKFALFYAGNPKLGKALKDEKIVVDDNWDKE